MKKAIVISIIALVVGSCGVYSFTGTSIQPDVETICIELFEYKALRVNPSLSNDLTEEIRAQFRKMTRLEQVDGNGDLTISGEVTGYGVSAAAITAEEVAAKNRLTVSVSVNFENRKHPEDNFEGKAFSSYADFDSSQSLDAVESTLIATIISTIVEDIFNATVAQW